MKKIKFVSAICLLQITLFSQPFYTGITTYNFGSVTPELSDGSPTQINSSGFVMSGFIPLVSAGVYNVYINKVDQDALFNATPSEFTIGYHINTGGNSCGITLAQELNCYGTTLKETFVVASTTPLVPSNLWYVSTAAFGSGCAFTGLDANGIIVTSGYYPFPSGATSPSKPLISESIVHPGQFYISGSYQDGTIRKMYAMCVDAAGTIVWTKLYDLGPTTSILPRAIIESPYSGSPELIIVGMAEYSTTLKEGFFARIDYGTNGGVNQFTTYGDGINATNDYFTSIAAANSPSGGSVGYIIGGHTEQNSLNGKAWVVKCDQTGSVIWSTRVKPSILPLDGEVVDVIERFSLTYGAYEYYALATSARGSLLLKLDDNGSFFFQPGNTNNELYLQTNFGTTPANIQVPSRISFLENNTVNDGIHVYGTTNNTGTGSFIFTQTYFNGVGGTGLSCYTNFIISYGLNSTNIFGGPNTTNTPGVNTNPGISNCNNYAIFQNNTTVSTSQPCFYEYVNNTIGDQSKPIGTTGLVQNNLPNPELIIYPNPSKNEGIVKINGDFQIGDKISIFNSLGEKIILLNVEFENSQSQIDLSRLELSSGLYFMKVETNSGILKGKLKID